MASSKRIFKSNETVCSRFIVAAHAFGDRPRVSDPAAIEPETVLADVEQRAAVVADEQDGAAPSCRRRPFCRGTSSGTARRRPPAPRRQSGFPARGARRRRRRGGHTCRCCSASPAYRGIVSTSANATISSNVSSTSARVMPRMAPLRKMFSRPVSSGWKPVPTSSRLATRPRMLMRPLVGSVMRLRIFSRVDLPAPLRPMMPDDLALLDFEARRP